MVLNHIYFFRKFTIEINYISIMNSAELKLNLINKITQITDIVQLKELLQLLKFQSDDSVYHTTEAEKKAVLEGRNQVKNGEILSHTEVENEMNKWLSK